VVGTQRNPTEKGLDVSSQMEHEKVEVKRRKTWLSLLARGKKGLNIQTMRSVFLALYRSKIAYGLLLKEPYLDHLTKWQNSAVRVVTSALFSCPAEIIYDFLDLPNLPQLFQSMALKAYARIIDNQIDPLAENYFDWVEEDEGMNNHFTPFGIIQEASTIQDEQILSKVKECQGKLDNKYSFGSNHTEIIPVVGRDHWKPTDFGEEVVIYTDGGYDPKSRKGAWAYWSNHPKIGSDSGSFFPCFNSTVPEEKALSKVLLKVRKALTQDDLHHSDRINLNTDNGGIISGCQGWPKLPRLPQTRYDIMEHISQLQKELKARIRLCWVPAHKNITGNEICDEACTNELLDPDNSEYEPISGEYFRMKATQVRRTTPLKSLYQGYYTSLDITRQHKKKLRSMDRKTGVTVSDYGATMLTSTPIF
jgi:ribonuclease HI